MKFGYFTLSDNHYENNPRDANRLVADILDETVYADELGYHSAWIGEHHFNSLTEAARSRRLDRRAYSRELQGAILGRRLHSRDGQIFK
jgi:alkanesulfonate monooxygenase SsuD/methylene tetrahydromethanopterin reductase-like flavin-dependent oxidoreductase (luciferase family)